MSMSRELQTRIAPRVLEDYAFKRSDDGRWFNQGKCPACGKRSLFTSAEAPWVLRCGRESKCGAEFAIRDLYPEEFGQFNQRFPVTESNPQATADAYMSEGRGLNAVFMREHGYYTQEKWWSPKADKGTATVRFLIPGTNGSYMERFVDPVEVTAEDGSREIRKQNFKGPHRGWWWQAPDMTIDDGDEVWITEAIIDAISLWQNSIKAVAILSCSNYPEAALKQLGALNVKWVLSDKGTMESKPAANAMCVTWVWALDNDKAGKGTTRKFVQKMREAGLTCTAAQCPAGKKTDWNDLHRLERLKPADLEDYKYYGALLVAESARDKALLRHARYPAAQFMVDFDNRLYWAKEEKNPQSEEADLSIRPISNARPEFLYFQRNEITDESWFYCRIHFPDQREPINMPFTPGQVTTSAEFKKRMASAQGAWWSGEAVHLDWIGSRWLSKLKTINTIEFIGYSREHSAYIFPQFAVKAGKAYPINEEDFFDLPRDSVKTLARDGNLHLQADAGKYRRDWPQLVWQAFGADGLVACVYWFGSLFAEQLRRVQGSFPFLEIIGEPGSGKTTLIEFIWRLFGREDYEGIDPNKNTFAGNQRKMVQFSGMPTVFIEADRDEDSHSKKFDWEEVKPYYNGRGLRVRGMKNSGNETYEPPFRGTLVIAQNEPVNASDAVLERIIQRRFTRANHSSESKAATDEMMACTVESLSYFVLQACLAEEKIVAAVKERTPLHQANLLKRAGINTLRLAKNHAQLIALAEQFALLVGLSTEQKNATCMALASACEERQIAIAADHPIVSEFWDVFDYIDAQKEHRDDPPAPLLNHSRDPELIAVNLNEFIEKATLYRQQVPLLRDLKRHLKTSKTRKFIDSSRTVCSAIASNHSGQPKTPRCWVFKRGKGEVIA